MKGANGVLGFIGRAELDNTAARASAIAASVDVGATNVARTAKVIFESLPGNVERQVGDAQGASRISTALLWSATTIATASTIAASRGGAVAAGWLFASEVHADRAAVDFLAVGCVFGSARAVRVFKGDEAESFGPPGIPVHSYEGVDNGSEFPERVEQNIFVGVERKVANIELDGPSAAAACTGASTR
jgi:hypothetical protein